MKRKKHSKKSKKKRKRRHTSKSECLPDATEGQAQVEGQTEVITGTEGEVSKKVKKAKKKKSKKHKKRAETGENEM